MSKYLTIEGTLFCWQNNCQQGMMQPEGEIAVNLDEQYLLRAKDETEDVTELMVQTVNDEQTFIYPNPFDDYLIVESMKEDVLIVQDINGKTISKQFIKKGTTRVDTAELSNGFYIVILMNQRTQTKFMNL